MKNEIIEYSYRKAGFFIDQFDKVGDVNLEEAIQKFSEFEFEKELQIGKESKMTSSPPAIRFTKGEEEMVEISKQDSEDFLIHYEKGEEYSDFYVSSSFLKNPEGNSVEEFIERFFSSDLEAKLHLKIIELEDEETMAPSKLFVYVESENKNWMKLLWCIPLIAIDIILLILFNNYGFNFESFLTLIFLTATLCIFWLHYSYWKKDSGAKLLVDIANKTIQYDNQQNSFKISREEILHCEIRISSGESPLDQYEHLKLLLKDESQIKITNFLIEPIEIVGLLKLNYSLKRTLLAFL